MMSRAVRSWRLLSWSLIRTGTGSGFLQSPGLRGQRGQVGAAPPLDGGQGFRVTGRPAVAHHRLQEGVVAERGGLVPQGEDIAVRAAVCLLGARRWSCPADSFITGRPAFATSL